jgi:Tfp pilus assembly major pilin PilA
MPASLCTQQRGAVLVEYLVVVIVTLIIADLLGPPLGKLAVEQYTARRAVLYSMYP